MSPTATLALGLFLYFCAVTGKAEAVWTVLTTDPPYHIG